MSKLAIHQLMICLVVMVTLDFRSIHGFPNRIPIDDRCKSKPLFLTPYIESNQIEKGRMLSEVHLKGTNLTSYSGFLTVDKRYDSNLFFWFWPALSNKTDSPIILWLEGGPGGSSLLSMFIENGPLMLVDEQGKLSSNNYTWNKDFAMIFIDNPVGVGFSFTKHDQGFATNEVQVAENLYKALEQFFTMFHEYQKNPLFVTGESYGGKYVPAIAYKIHKMGEQAKTKMNLQGLVIGDGWFDPLIQMNYGEFLFQVGLLDEIQRTHFIEEQHKMAALVEKKQLEKATDIMIQLIEGLDSDSLTYFHNVTDFDYYHNFLEQNPPNFVNCSKFLDLPETRKSIHVGDLKYTMESLEVFNHLKGDVMDTVKPWVEELLNADYRMMFYNGQLDIIVATPLLEDFLHQLHWKGEDKYKSSTRIIYRVDPKDEQVAGYVRQADNLYFAMIRRAGHGVILEQPRVAQDLVQRFIHHEPFDK